MTGARLDFVEELVREAGRRSLAGFGRVAPEEKASRDGYDIATVVDHEVETFVKERIAATWGEPVLGEEDGLSGERALADRALWLVDPIDGTFNFQHGVPLYGVSVAFCAARVPVLGAIYLPATDELYAGAVGRGAWRSVGGGPRERLRASPETRPERALFCLGGRDLAALAAAYFARGLPRRSLRVFLCASATLAYVAAGRMNAYVQSSLSPWDAAAGDVLLRAAGAPPCRNASGEPIFPHQLDAALAGGGPKDFVLVAVGNAALGEDVVYPVVREGLGYLAMSGPMSSIRQSSTVRKSRE